VPNSSAAAERKARRAETLQLAKLDCQTNIAL
jgi:hypothetical protein